MKYYNVFKVISGCALALTLAGCGGEQDSPNYYASHEVGQASYTHSGVIVSARAIKVNGGNNLGAGALVGGATGGLLGAHVGKGSLLGTGLGALVGGGAGHFAQKSLSNREAMEYVVELDNGNKLTIAQGKPYFYVGQSVYVMVDATGSSRSRIVAR